MTSNLTPEKPEMGANAPDSSAAGRRSIDEGAVQEQTAQGATTMPPPKASTVAQKPQQNAPSSPLLDQPDSVTGRRTVGTRLRQQRESRGLSVEDCYDVLRIRAQYLQAIEQENTEILPDDRTTVRAYVRCYADFLALDGNAMAQHFELEHFPELRAPRVSSKPLPTIPGNAILGIVLIVLVLLLIASILQNYVAIPEQDTLINAPAAPLPRQPDQNVTFSIAPADLSAKTASLSPPPQAASVTPVSVDAESVANTTIAHLINSQPTWVVMRGGSLSQEFQVLREAGEGMSIPVGEGVSIRVSNPQTVDIAFVHQPDETPVAQISYDNALSRQGHAPATSATVSDPTRALPPPSMQWIDIDTLWDNLRP